ncbi:hypothetical protein ACH5RR_039984 [Cinchona calisaya]|uniref:Uncharacterized protein n=1 Tax=Cinchona calisaya TaxID=153742 RepID=A0ABD2Y2B5_9GENT
MCDSLSILTSLASESPFAIVVSNKGCRFYLFISFKIEEAISGLSESITLPPPPTDTIWFHLVDTALPFPGFFALEGVPVEDGSVAYEMKSHFHLIVVLYLKPDTLVD